MTATKITLIKDIKPFMNNLTIECMIIKYIDDPPDHINNIEKYHYHVADKSGSVILCIPHIFIENELKKYKIDNYLHRDIEDMIDFYDSQNMNFNENLIEEMKEIYINSAETEVGVLQKELDPNRNKIRGIELKGISGSSLNRNENKNIKYGSVNHNNIYNNRMEIGDSLTNTRNEEKNNGHDMNCSVKKMLKYIFRIGDRIKICGAITTWSMGKMVVIPSTRCDKSRGDTMGAIYKIGFFNTEISIEPNVSNLIIGTTERKYKLEDRQTTNSNNNSNNNNQNMFLKEKSSTQEKLFNQKMQNEIINKDNNKQDLNEINKSKVYSNNDSINGKGKFLKETKKNKYDISFLL